MEGDREFEIPSSITGGLGSIPTIHVEAHDEAMSPTFPTSYLNKPSDPTLSSSEILKPGMGPADGCADEGVINPVYPTSPLTHFFFAIFSISLTLLVLFFTVAWFTIFRETRVMKDQILSDANGVSLHTLMIRRSY